LNLAPNVADLQDRLDAGLLQMDIALAPSQREKLLGFVALLVKWNKVYNLTAIREPLHMVSRHLFDCLTLLPHLHGSRMLDIGSGAGLPGIPVAIVRPDLHCMLLDSNRKKTRFIQQAIAELALPNVQVLHARVEEAKLDAYDTVVSRAFSSPVDIIRGAGHLCRADGAMLFMLGHKDGLFDSLPGEFELTQLESVTVPFEAGTRHIAVCRHRRSNG